MSELWRECLNCRDNCCHWDIASNIFITPEESERIGKLHPDKIKLFNKISPCPFLSEEGFCIIHDVKPVDCRLFPFDIIKIGDKFFWIVREMDCAILKSEEKLKEYLKDFEENMIPCFMIHMEEYALFRLDELSRKYKFKILREVQCDYAYQYGTAIHT